MSDIDDDIERIERTTVRTKFYAEGAETLGEVIKMAGEHVKGLCDLAAAGFELTEPVSDGYLHLEKQG